MNPDYFVMHIALEVLLTIVCGVVTAFFAYGFFTEKDKTAGLIALAALALTIGGLSWWIISANEPFRTQVVSYHEIKDVMYPDGSKVQMFTCDDQHHNVTIMYNKVVDEKQWYIKRVKFNPYYKGLSWSNMGTTCTGQHFFLEHKKGELPPVEIKDPVVTK